MNELESYKRAVWEFLLEHCELLPSGTLFVKFHTTGKKNFDNRVNARWKKGYHRENVNEKERLHEELKQIFLSKTQEKKLKYRLDKLERMEKKTDIQKAMKEVEQENQSFIRKRTLLQRIFT